MNLKLSFKNKSDLEDLRGAIDWLIIETSREVKFLQVWNVYELQKQLARKQIDLHFKNSRKITLHVDPNTYQALKDMYWCFKLRNDGLNNFWTAKLHSMLLDLEKQFEPLHHQFLTRLNEYLQGIRPTG